MKSLPVIILAVIPLLLMMIPSMLSDLSVLLEKELGSMINLYVTHVQHQREKLMSHCAFVIACEVSVSGMGV